MDAEDLIVDDDGESEEVEHVSEIVPNTCVAIFPRALCVEAVRLGDTARLVITADEVDAVGVAELQAYEERYGFDGEETAIDVIA